MMGEQSLGETVFSEMDEARARLRDKALLCTSTGRPLDPLQCWCCTGIGCVHKFGAFSRLIWDLHNRPWRYAGEKWVYRALGRRVPKATSKVGDGKL